MHPWEKASTGGTRGGPLYQFMRMTIGSYQIPEVHAIVFPKPLSKVGRAALLGAIASL